MSNRTLQSGMMDAAVDADRSTTIRCTESQREIWLSVQLGEDASCAYNESISLRLRGGLDVEALCRAMDTVLERHGSLGAVFSREGEHMRLSAVGTMSVRQEDLSDMPSEKREERRREVLEEEVVTPFDLEQGPLVRCRLLRTCDEEYWFVVTAHHIVCDGWSMAVIVQDLAAAYDALTTGQDVDVSVADRFDRYAEMVERYEQSDEAARDERYWLEQYADGVPVMELPTDRARPTLKTYVADRFDHELPAELVAALRRVGARAGCSFLATLLAGVQIWLARLSGQNDMVVGVPAAGQSACGLEQLAGHCVNTLPIRGQIDLEQGFAETLQRTRGLVLDAFEHQRFTYGTLVRKLAPARDPSRLPVVNVLFNYDRTVEAGKLGFAGLNVQMSTNPRRFETFDMFVNVSDTGGRVVLECQYNTDLFDRTTIGHYLAALEALLRAAADAPERPLGELPWVDDAQRQQIAEWNRTERAYPMDAPLHELIRQQAERVPQSTAVVCGGQQLTYSELEQRANRLARYLIQRGVVRGELVGLCVERSIDMVVALVGILKAGGAYVPLDPSYPSQRLAYMCEQARLKLLLTETALQESVSAFGVETVCLDAEAASIERQPSEAPEVRVGPENLTYVIFTSGSTGQPKGVQVPHGPVVNFLTSMRQEPGLDETDVVFALTTLSFDIHVLELFLPLTCGATCVVVERAVAEDGQRLADAIEEYRPTLVQATPSTWRLLCASNWSGSPGLKALIGGEPLPADLLGPLLSRVGSLWNMYGPTETTVWSTCRQIVDATAPILIGRPIANTQIYLFDESRQLVPIGAPGEVYIGGAGVTLGYLHRPELTEDRFVVNPYHDPFCSHVSVKLYRTGDLARYREDGNLEFLRRVDKQVKVRGYRIELGEIEQALGLHVAVRQGVVTVREDQPGDSRLVAYFVGDTSRSVTSSELRKHLRTTLPAYMIPQHFVELDELPKTNNGKIDYKALPPVGGRSERADEVTPPVTLNECLVAEVWCRELKLEQVGRHDNFFHLGGHSLLAMKTIAEIERLTSVRISPRELLAGTLEQIAALLPEQVEEASSQSTDEEDRPGGMLRNLKQRWFNRADR